MMIWWIVILCFEIASSLSTPSQTTIKVCAGADCRLDGASACLKAFQQISRNETFRVVATKCLGPCGDGPNAIIVQNINVSSTQQRVVNAEVMAKDRTMGSLVPADIFGANLAGVYQVRTASQLQDAAQFAKSTLVECGEGDDIVVPLSIPRIESQRKWYDRPRNERLMLQRAMHVCQF